MKSIISIAAAAALVAGVVATGAPPQRAEAASPPIQTTTSGAPATIPALANWTAGDGGFEFEATTSVVAAAAQSKVASQLATDLTNALESDVTVETSGASNGDVQLNLDASTKAQLGEEGYRVVVGDTISITAATEAGLFYGGQSVTQWAVQAGLTKSVPAGSATDVPAYSVRGAGVCACIIQISEEKFEETIKEMAYYKMNELWLEIKVESESLPLATFWSYYTHEQAQRLSKFAADHHVRIVAEVNSPGHMEPWIAPYPELQLVNKDGVRQSSQLDITKPEALTTVTTLADEYFEHFDTDYWHMGADEYLLGSGQLTDFPQFLETAQANWGPTAKEIDVFIDFINQVNGARQEQGQDPADLERRPEALQHRRTRQGHHRRVLDARGPDPDSDPHPRKRHGQRRRTPLLHPQRRVGFRRRPLERELDAE
ncbi:Glycosyl hydrolase family 20, catalytic domain [Tessaracoccus bendigoensis DSM 12906]|uniref:Glycosyl hydrolase family 20, catalytic domain n=1 Tax=Tessaracoccus bendigoensis DSM 12906 TaxID=1123357 RepID=A0A1M6NS42_9ACTN|nr:glycoside hydrolase family 20 zincin-like fold domain-containing protein [Tessaracoccus bendigoensis]SHJ98539.1 Glycosyl hydrolase family 20, catalytic domain [Tessaracoccus bendigoensis DSM 12906]